MGGRWKNTNFSRVKADGLGTRIRQRVAEVEDSLGQKFGITDLSTAIDLAYDTTRKIYNGEEFPGPKALVKICEVLELDLQEMQTLKRDDQLAWKNAVSLEHKLVDPVAVRLDKLLKFISDENKEKLLLEARRMADEGISTPKRKTA